MDHYLVTLEGFPADSGDVISKDGEVIGTYTSDENDYCEFTPSGGDAPMITGYFVGIFCSDIAKWHDQQQT